ncbi:uncharacterized protein [Ptychodera flava]|uniref:uncharacterized protein n=1 Tax=Ptychodera flava TaxID=63121 RepID=UPI00396A88E1
MRTKSRTKGVTVKPETHHIGIQCNLIDARLLVNEVGLSQYPDDDDGEDDDDDGEDDDDEDQDEDVDDDDDGDGDDDFVSYQSDLSNQYLPQNIQSSAQDDPLNNANANQPHREEKFLVFRTELLALFDHCPQCNGPTHGDISKRVGSLIHVTQKCGKCGHIRTWISQPYLGKMPAGNLLTIRSNFIFRIHGYTKPEII